jgi:hypothetical protein
MAVNPQLLTGKYTGGFGFLNVYFDKSIKD